MDQGSYWGISKADDRLGDAWGIRLGETYILHIDSLTLVAPSGSEVGEWVRLGRRSNVRRVKAAAAAAAVTATSAETTTEATAGSKPSTAGEAAAEAATSPAEATSGPSEAHGRSSSIAVFADL